MDFTQLSFLVFLVAIAAVCRICPLSLRPILLVAASYAFYCTWSSAIALLLAGATTAAFLAARGIESANSDHAKRGFMLSLVCALIGLLVLFKSPPILRGPLSHLWMPLGISYYTFKLISYAVDVYWGKTTAERNFLAFAAYAAFFPQIVAGPIQRSESFLPQLHDPRPVRLDPVVLGLQRIILGFFKKFVVADNLARVVNFDYGNLHAAGTPLIAAYYAYPLQIYADFSGLSDIAIGAALLLGIESTENFNAPFAARNIAEFWRRWHITLSSWLTDYVFTPLRMETRSLGNAGLVLSLMTTMTLIGIWHGFRWGFALFGVVHGVYLSVDALTTRFRQRYYKTHRTADLVTNWLGPIVTFHLAATAFVFFRAETLRDAVYFLGHFAKGWQTPSAEFLAIMQPSGTAIWAGFGGYLLIEIADYARRRNQHSEFVRSLPRWGRWSVYWCTFASVMVIMLLLMGGNVGRNPFIYEIF